VSSSADRDVIDHQLTKFAAVVHGVAVEADASNRRLKADHLKPGYATAPARLASADRLARYGM